MVQCPRCGDVVEELEPLPADGVGSGGSEQDATEARACSWCRHELLEG